MSKDYKAKKKTNIYRNLKWRDKDVFGHRHGSIFTNGIADSLQPNLLVMNVICIVGDKRTHFGSRYCDTAE